MLRAVLVGFASVCIGAVGGCGGSKSNASEVPGASCASGDADGGQDAFEPSSVNYTFTSALNPDQLKLVASSVVQVSHHLEWLVAIQNNSTEMRCNLTARAYFLDATMQQLGVIGDVPVHGTMSRTDIYPAAPCIASGQVGIGQAPILFGASMATSLSGLMTVDYGLISYHNPEATVNGISLDDVSVNGCTLTGTFHNAETAAIEAPKVYLYPLNDVGRPLQQVVADGPTAIDPGGSWDFSLSAGFSLGKYAIYGEYGQP